MNAMFSGKLSILWRLVRELSRGNASTLRKLVRLLASEYRPDNSRYEQFETDFFAKERKPPGHVVVYLIPGFTYGGAEITDFYLVRELSKQGFSIYLLGTDVNFDSNVWFKKFEEVAHRTIWLPDCVPGFKNQAHFIGKLIDQFEARIVFNRNSGTGYRTLPRLAKLFPDLRLVDLIHTHDFGNDWISYSSATAHHLHRRVVTNQDLLAYCLKNSSLPANRHKVIYCGTDTDAYPDLSERAAIRSAWLHEHGLPSTACIVTYYGRFSNQKNPQRWLQVATHLARLKPDIYFLLAGDGELLAQTQQAFRRAGLLDKALFTGRIDQVVPVACATDVLLLTSHFEGLPTVCFEFLMMGVPVLATDVGGTRECINRPELGDVFPLDTPDPVIAGRVLNYFPVAGQQQELLRATRRQHIIHFFSVHRMRERYVTELNQLLEDVD